MTQEEPNPLMRKKKTPEELAAEAEAEEEDEITSTCLFAISHSRRMRSNLGREEVEANFWRYQGRLMITPDTCD